MSMMMTRGSFAHGGEVHRLVEVARTRASVADVVDGGLALAARLGRPRHARRDGHHGADVADELGDALGAVAHVKVPVSPAGGAVGAPEEMRHDAPGRVALGEVRTAVAVHGHEPFVIFQTHCARDARPLVSPAEKGGAGDVARAKGGIERLLDRARQRDEVVHAPGGFSVGENFCFGEAHPARFQAVHGEVAIGQVGIKIEVGQLLARGEGVIRVHATLLARDRRKRQTS